MGDASEQAFSITSITVKPDRVVGEVRVNTGFPQYSSPVLIERICEILPSLPEHTCKNSEGNTFSAVMGHTSIPHLFEHMVIDIQVQQAPESKVIFVATTEWVDEEKGTARVEVSFTDDLDALRAFRDAAQILNNAMV